MSDWGVYELEDIVWGEFGGNDDHIVPHPGGTTVRDYVDEGDRRKKPRSAAASAVRRSTDSKTSVTKNDSQGKEKTTFHLALEDGTAPMLEKGSWSHSHENVFPSSCDSDCINLATGLAPEDTKISNSCFKSSNVDSVGSEFCSDDQILGNGGAEVDNNLCHFQLDDISAAESDLEFFGNGHDQKGSSDLLYYGWPDIGNFEDVDRMFRNCDSTFGQGDNGTANELSWFSASSHANDRSEDTSKAGFRSLCSEGSVLKNASGQHEIDPKSVPASDHLPISDYDKKKGSSTSKKSSWDSYAIDYSSYANWFGAVIENEESASMDQEHEENGSDEVKISPQTPIGNESSVTGCQCTDVENVQSKQSKSLEGNRKEALSSKNLNGTLHGHGPVQQFSDLKLPSSVQSSSQVFSQQRQLVGDDSFRYLHAYTPYGHQQYSHPSHQFPVTSTVSSIIRSEKKNHPLSYKVSGHASISVPPVEISPIPLSKLPTVISEEKVKALHYPQKIRTAMSNENQHDQFVCHDTFTGQGPVLNQLHQIQDEVGGDSEVEETGIEFAAADIGSSTVQESSCVSSVLSNEISLEATSFRQLQDVMEQLDIRTKLCIRDSLYRLARSAEQRHNFCKTKSTSRDKRGRSGTSAEESNKCLGFMDPETDTNPIDRSIAHLLFYRPSGPSTRPSNDALSLQSRVGIHGSTTNQPVMHDQLVCQKDIAGDTDMKLPITEL